ncbi:MAG: hypothetical protein KC636_34190, partial [Myxococcales bacterium]|nr:hypothetical protein [Myxococcales bacterium]
GDGDGDGDCGNGSLDDGEACDGALIPITCEELGYTEGAPTCASDCAAIDTTSCAAPLFVEDFESGLFAAPPWDPGVDALWWVADTNAHEGEHAAQVGPIADDSTAALVLGLDFGPGGQASFWYRVSSEYCCDRLHFYVDDEERGSWGGQTGWEQVFTDVGPGYHELRWTYEKDESLAVGLDTVLLDDIAAEATIP